MAVLERAGQPAHLGPVLLRQLVGLRDLHLGVLLEELLELLLVELPVVGGVMPGEDQEDLRRVLDFELLRNLLGLLVRRRTELKARRRVSRRPWRGEPCGARAAGRGAPRTSTICTTVFFLLTMALPCL
jgi:hypothetical protein